MISNISFSGIIKPQTSCQGKPVFPLLTIEKDSFEVNPLSKTIFHARNKILEVLKENNTEYGFTISPDGKISEETNGDEHSCRLDSRKIELDSILIHGHPVPVPLSSGDVAILLSTDAKTMEAVTIDGKYSRLTKKYPQKTQQHYREIYCNLEKQLRMYVLDELGIDYKINKQDLMVMFKDFMSEQSASSLSDEDAIKAAAKFSINLEDDELEKTQNQINSLMSYQLLLNPYKYDKIHNLLLENNELINQYLNTPLGTQTIHNFLRDIAQKYDLIYETNI